MRAFYFDDIHGEPHLPHDSGLAASAAILRSIGVDHRYIPAEEGASDEINSIAKERRYKGRDEITISEAGLGAEYVNKLEMFFTEHLHEDEEIRYVKSGSGFFDVREVSTGRWIRIHVTAGDLLVRSAGIYHRFTLDEASTITFVRLFKDSPNWTAHNRSAETDATPIRQMYIHAAK